MACYNIRLFPDGLQTINSATLTGIANYLPLGTPTTNSTRIYRLTNLSNMVITYAWNGIVADVLPAGGFVLFDVSSNKENNNVLEIPAGTQTSIAGAAGGTGLIYLATFYAG